MGTPAVKRGGPSARGLLPSLSQAATPGLIASTTTLFTPSLAQLAPQGRLDAQRPVGARGPGSHEGPPKPGT